MEEMRKCEKWKRKGRAKRKGQPEEEEAKRREMEQAEVREKRLGKRIETKDELAISREVREVTSKRKLK